MCAAMVPDPRQNGTMVPDTVYLMAARVMNYKLQQAASVADRQRLQPTKANLQRFIRENPELIPLQPR